MQPQPAAVHLRDLAPTAASPAPAQVLAAFVARGGLRGKKGTFYPTEWVPHGMFYSNELMLVMSNAVAPSGFRMNGEQANRNTGVIVHMAILNRQPHAPHTIFQNLDRRIEVAGSGTSKIFSEAWEDGSRAYEPADLFTSPPDQRAGMVMEVITEAWVEPQGLPTYFEDHEHRPDPPPWGRAGISGDEERCRSIPANTWVTHRYTLLRWDSNGTLLPVVEDRRMIRYSDRQDRRNNVVPDPRSMPAVTARPQNKRPRMIDYPINMGPPTAFKTPR